MVDRIRKDGTFNYNEVSSEFTSQISTQESEYQDAVEKDFMVQQATNMIGTYDMPQYDPAELEDTRNKHEKKHGLKSIREAIAHVFGRKDVFQ